MQVLLGPAFGGAFMSLKNMFNCLLAHAVINMNGGRPKAALVGLRLTCSYGEWPKVALADDRPSCTFVFKACGIMRPFIQASPVMHCYV